MKIEVAANPELVLNVGVGWIETKKEGLLRDLDIPSG